MVVIAEGILRGCQGLSTPVSLGYPLSVFNKKALLSKCRYGHPLGGCGSVFGLIPGYTTLLVRVRANI